MLLALGSQAPQATVPLSGIALAPGCHCAVQWHCPGLTEWGGRRALPPKAPVCGQRTRPDGGADGPGRGRLGSLAWPEGVCGGTRLPLKSLEVSEKATCGPLACDAVGSAQRQRCRLGGL